jgi:hypothetical protein
MNLQESQTASQVLPAKPLNNGKIAASGEIDLEKEVFGNDGFSFKDLLDVINPLQHIPGVSTVYRDLTGDDISPASRIAGGTLFFGPIGAAISTANVVVDKTTGKDIGDHVMAVFTDNENDGTVLAGAEPIGDSADDTNPAQLASWTNPTAAVQTAENRPLSDQEYRSLVAQGEPFILETASLSEGSVSALKAQGEPFDLGASNKQLAATESTISDTHVAFLMAHGEPFVDEGHTEIDLSPAAALTPLLTQSAAQETNQKPADLSRRTQAYASVSPEVLEWASHEIAERSRTARAAKSQPGMISPDTELAGATAKEGGWFSEVMLSALKSYEGANTLSNSLAPSGATK